MSPRGVPLSGKRRASTSTMKRGPQKKYAAARVRQAYATAVKKAPVRRAKPQTRTSAKQVVVDRFDDLDNKLTLMGKMILEMRAIANTTANIQRAGFLDGFKAFYLAGKGDVKEFTELWTNSYACLSVTMADLEAEVRQFKDEPEVAAPKEPVFPEKDDSEAPESRTYDNDMNVL